MIFFIELLIHWIRSSFHKEMIKIINSYYNKQELEFAQSQNIIHYMISNGFSLKKEGALYFRSVAHDSLVIKHNGQWTWNSKDLCGNKPVELLKQLLIYDCGYDEKDAYITAIKKLAGTERAVGQVTYNQPLLHIPKESNPILKGAIQLPSKNNNAARGIHYLCKIRGLDEAIIRQLIQQNKIYETKEHHNVCFVSYDQEHCPRHAFLRGTITTQKGAFKKDIENSDKSYGFLLESDYRTNRVFCFESTIDLLSHASLYKLNDVPHKDVYRLSLHGTSFLALERFLKERPYVDEIVSCLDRDEAGMRRTKKMCKEFREQGYKTFVQLPTKKDYNEQLLDFRFKNEQRVQESDYEMG